MCLCVLYKPSPSQSRSFRVWHLNTGPGSHWLISSWGWSNPSFSGSDMSTPAAVVSALQIKMSPTSERGTTAASSSDPGPGKQWAFELLAFGDLFLHFKLQDVHELFASISGEFGRIIYSRHHLGWWLPHSAIYAIAAHSCVQTFSWEKIAITKSSHIDTWPRPLRATFLCVVCPQLIVSWSAGSSH